MEDFIYILIYLAGFVLSIILIFRFFALCRNVVAVKNELLKMNNTNETLIKDKAYWYDQYLMYKAFGDYSKAIDIARKVLWFEYNEIKNQEYPVSVKDKQLEELRREWEPLFQKQGLSYPAFNNLK